MKNCCLVWIMLFFFCGCTQGADKNTAEEILQKGVKIKMLISVDEEITITILTAVQSTVNPV